MTKKTTFFCSAALLTIGALLQSEMYSKKFDDKDSSQDSFCPSKEIISQALAASTIATMYSLVGFCEEKYPENQIAYNNCISSGIPIMTSGMEKYSLLPKSEIDKAIKSGTDSGKRLFHEGAGWVEELKKQVSPN